MYVWCDALSNYISALGFGSENDENYKTFWPADVHVVGKDILRFHAIIWPAMLLSAELPLPKKIFVHGFLTLDGKKMSKSLGNIIDPTDLVNEYGADALRYYLLREVTPFEDGNITMEKFKEAYNANLANGLGNLVSRIMKMAEINLNESVERPEPIPFDKIYTEALDNFEFNKATDLIWKKIGELDMRIQETQPFKLIKEDREKAIEIIKKLVQDLYVIARLLNPIMPETSKTIKSLIKENKSPDTPLFLRK